METTIQEQIVELFNKEGIAKQSLSLYNHYDSAIEGYLKRKKNDSDFIPIENEALVLEGSIKRREVLKIEVLAFNSMLEDFLVSNTELTKVPDTPSDYSYWQLDHENNTIFLRSILNLEDTHRAKIGRLKI